MARLTNAEKEAARLCAVPGCERPWASVWSNGLGKRCALHMAPPAPAPSTPTTPPARPWSDTEKDDDEAMQ